MKLDAQVSPKKVSLGGTFFVSIVRQKSPQRGKVCYNARRLDQSQAWSKSGILIHY